MSEIAYRDNRGSWSLRIFWNTFVRSKTEFNFFLLSVSINAVGMLGRVIVGWSELGSDLVIAFLWLLIIVSALFVVGVVIAVIRSSLVDARDVSGKEARAPLETVAALLTSGQLDERTLVDVGRGWQSIGDCFEFEDAIIALGSRRSRRRAITVLVVLAAIAAIGFGIASSSGDQ